MSSAAVIGRQLRQHNKDGRTSGPLVPPPYKGRPRTPSQAVSGNRPYSPAATSTGTAGPVSRQAYASPADRDRNKCAKEEEPKLKCTWHCFCIALKALSGGIVLLIAGTIMSIVGFVAESHYNQTVITNGTTIAPPIAVPSNSSDSQSTFRNLTYAGTFILMVIH